MDMALLVVAADDGWMPQTEEHLQILEYLGVKHLVAVVSKCDLDTQRAEAVRKQVVAELSQTDFVCGDVSLLSSKTGAGMDQLRRELMKQACLIESQSGRWSQIWVDRAFTVKGVGAVVTGTMQRQSLKVGQAITMYPTGLPCKVRGIQSHSLQLEESIPGARTAVNLAGVDIGERGLKRGCLLSDHPDLAKFKRVDVRLIQSQRTLLPERRTPVLKTGAFVWLHIGTLCVEARLRLKEGKGIRPGEPVLASLTFKSPVVAFEGERFVIRDSSQRWTIGGGLILAGVEGLSPRFGNPRRQVLLENRAALPESVAVWMESAINEETIVHRAQVLKYTQFSGRDLEQSICESRNMEQIGSHIWQSKIAADTHARVVRVLEKFHEEHPDKRGMKVAELRFAKRIPPDAANEFLKNRTDAEWEISNELIHLKNHRIECPPELIPEVERIREVLRRDPMAPPSRSVLCDSQQALDALRYLEAMGEVVCPNSELVLNPAGFNRIKRMIKSHLRKASQATVSELRQAVGASRRIVMPVLDLLDKEGVTERNGDYRKLKG